MKLQLIQSDSQLRALRDDWNRLAEPTPLRRWEWHAAWWAAFGAGQQLATVVVRDGEQVVAIAPWYVGVHSLKGRVLEFLGSGRACTDYQGILAAPSAREEAVALIADALKGKGLDERLLSTVDLLEFEGVVGDDLSMRQLLVSLSDSDFQIQSRALESSWIAPTSIAGRPLLECLSSAQRRKVRKAATRAQSPGIAFHVARTVE